MISRKMLQDLQYAEIEELLRLNPALANSPIAYSTVNPKVAHPLHRICDGVFEGAYSDLEAQRLAKLFLAYGADIEGGIIITGEDTPLIAACSLHAEEVAILYLDLGANIHHQGCMGGTALHWAGWTGCDRIVKRLLEHDPKINQPCTEHGATPLFWSIHGYLNHKSARKTNHTYCAQLLLAAGADPSIPNEHGTTIQELLSDHRGEMVTLFGMDPT